jgi:heat shock protein HslJ
MKRIFLVSLVLISLVQMGWAKRMNPNLIVNGNYVLVGVGAKNVAPKYSHNLDIDRGAGEMSLDGAKTKIVIAAGFNTNQKVLIGKSKKANTPLAAKKAQDAETVKIAAALKKANRFEKQGAELRLYNGTILICTLNEVVKTQTSSNDGSRVVISDGGDVQVMPTLEGRFRIIQQMMDGQMADCIGKKSLLEFGEEKLSANVGCNSINSTFVSTGNSLKIGQMIMSRKSCGDELNKLEQATTMNLTQASTFRIESNKAMLEDAAGNLIMMLERTR